MLTKMLYNYSLTFGAAASIVGSFYIRLKNTSTLGDVHIKLMIILMLILICDHLLGYRISKKNKIYKSGLALDGLVRDTVSISIAMICYIVDNLIGTGALVFASFVLALSFHNLQSIIANIYVLGWQRFFPMWLFNWLKSEIEAKIKKIKIEKE